MKKLQKQEFKKLKEADTYSLLFFILYLMKKIPEYKTLVDMIFIYDKDTVLKMCEYFGGTTITIPTTKQLIKALHILALYESIDIEGIPYETAIEKADADNNEIKAYNTLKDILKEYNINDITRYTE